MAAQLPSRHQSSLQTFFKRVGIAGFIFFLAKGLLWIIVPTMLVFFGYQAN